MKPVLSLLLLALLSACATTRGPTQSANDAADYLAAERARLYSNLFLGR